MLRKDSTGAREVSGHDFSGADNAFKTVGVVTPEGCFSDIELYWMSFSVACSAPATSFSSAPLCGPPGPQAPFQGLNSRHTRNDRRESLNYFRPQNWRNTPLCYAR